MSFTPVDKLNASDGDNIYFYTHWGGDDDINQCDLAQGVRNALRDNRDRFDDESIIASQILMSLYRASREIYCIAPSPERLDEEFPRVVIDLGSKRVNGISYDKFISLYD